MAAADRLEGADLFAHPIAAAVVSVITARGYEDATVAEFLQRSGMSREEFDAQFEDKQEATLRVFEAYIDDYRTRAARAYESEPTWPDNMRAAGWESMRWMREHPEATWFGMTGVLEAGEMARVRREELFKWCASLISAGREVAEDPDSVPEAAPLIVIGAILELLRRQQEGSTEFDTVALIPSMMYAAVKPYLGEEAARRELERPPPPDLRGAGGR
jgi:AcrR family transcriptional regulator